MVPSRERVPERVMVAERQLIVNADDLGLSPGVNRGIIEAHERGIVTSASLMVRWPAAEEAAAYARQHPDLSVGLHVDLGEWRCLNDTWVPVYEIVTGDGMTDVQHEITRQLESFRSLIGREPTHFDSHQHVHRDEPALSILLGLARATGVPLRDHSTRVRYCGAFYGQTATGLPFHEAITVQALVDIVEGLPSGVTEVGCHPGEGTDLESSYRDEREQEVAVLCDARIREAVAAAGIRLCSFSDIHLGELR